MKGQEGDPRDLKGSREKTYACRSVQLQGVSHLFQGRDPRISPWEKSRRGKRFEPIRTLWAASSGPVGGRGGEVRGAWPESDPGCSGGASGEGQSGRRAPGVSRLP